MAFDQPTRNRLARFVGEARALLTEEFTRQLQHEYGLDPARGEVTELARLTQLDDARRETARILRETLAHYLAGQPTPTAKACQEALDRLVREQAFTVLNRLCALRMAEARGLLIESIAKGYQSRGFQLYARLAGPALGETGEAYRAYLFSLFDEFGVDLAVLFDRFSPQGRLFPRASTLLQLLAAINHPDLEPLWGEDETIGWIYQYFNSKEERKAMRDASQAPRNSRELAVRNQFFTPRYVVEFLTDNTLGRIWYEMTQGRTSLVDSCRYLVRRPHEIFLNEGEEAPTDKVTGFDVSSAERGQGDQDLTQQELLRQPVYIPFRQIKDPRTILMLDPACGSMHFGLYSFDLYERIYEEAWALEGELGAHAFERPAVMAPLRERYRDKVSFLRDVPRLIIEHNIHGIDIDPRAVQIAGLSLWLRAQRSWQTQGLKPHERPTIRKSNIVCAEPMPGDKALLEEFLQGLRDDRLEALIRQVLAVPENQRIRATPMMADTLCNLVRTIWEEMKLASEAGSLLKIGEALTEAIARGRAEWEEKMPLFRIETFRLTEEKAKVNYATVIPGEEVDFWTRAEALVLSALKKYATLNEDEVVYQRHLFVDDATRGFTFVDLCRKKYDFVLMNPPFGAASDAWRPTFQRDYFRTKNDLYAAFVEFGLTVLSSGGILGAITSRTGFFLTSFQKWREEIVLRDGWPTTFVDLGFGVLDSAMVETAAYCLQRSNGSKAIFFRLLADEDKSSALVNLFKKLLSDDKSNKIFYANPLSFAQIPGTPFTYPVSENIRNLYSKYSPLESSGRVTKIGMGTLDDNRFMRTWWEVQNSKILTGGSQDLAEDFRKRTFNGSEWVYFVKGTSNSPYYANFSYVVNFEQDGAEVKAYVAAKVGSASRKIQAQDYYFLSGITWPRRPLRRGVFSLVPTGMILSDNGPMLFLSKEEYWYICALLNSTVYINLLHLRMSRGEAGSSATLVYETGFVGGVPVPSIDSNSKAELSKIANHLYYLQYRLNIVQENSCYFYIPAIFLFYDETLVKRSIKYQEFIAETKKQITDGQHEIDNIAFQVYGIKGSERQAIEDSLKFETNNKEYDVDHEDDSSTEDSAPVVEDTTLISDFLSYIFGCIFGRWDIYFALGKKSKPELPDPLAPLPACSPGMLLNSQGLPVTLADAPVEYPVYVSWSGILVNAPGHPEDIEQHVRDVLRLIWPNCVDAIEQEACKILGVASLRSYFANPNSFFDDHLKRYSKSRRVAPIYWPLSTPSGSYTLWLYYHRLTDQTLYSCVNDFVEPKLKGVNDEVNKLRQRANRSRQEEKELDRLSDLALELAAFRDELLRIARFWQPNLNDGVQITAAPLWRLFQHRAWQKRLKETWAALEAGDYDWAHLAYSMWPERVRAKCKTDKSLAIAHDLEELYVEPVKPVKAKKGGRKAKVEAETMGLFEGDTTAD